MHVNPRQLRSTCRGTLGPTERWRLKVLSAGIHPFTGESLSDFHYLARLGWVDNLDTLEGDFIAAEEAPSPGEVEPPPPAPKGRVSRKTVALGSGALHGEAGFAFFEEEAVIEPVIELTTEESAEQLKEVDDLNTR